jgi:hypothetical protein
MFCTLKIEYVFLGITIFSLTYPILEGRGGVIQDGLEKFTDPVSFLRSLGPLAGREKGKVCRDKSLRRICVGSLGRRGSRLERMEERDQGQIDRRSF